MADVSVTFEGTRLSTADTEAAGGTWDKYGASQSPALEEDIILQGPTETSVKISSTTGGLQFLATTSFDAETTPKTIIAKIQVTTIKAIDTSIARGLSYEVGTDDANNYQYYLVGSGAGDEYPVNAGWWTIIIDPNVVAHRDATILSPNLTTCQWVGLYANITTGVKAENIIHSGLDYVDNGKGLLLVGGDGVSVDGVLEDFVIEDEDVNITPGEYDNRWRLAARSAGSSTVFDAVAWWTIGSSANPAVLVDSNKAIKWASGRVDTSFHGLRLDIQNATTNITLSSCSFVSNGTAATNDSRADFEVIGTSGAATVNGCSFLNFNNITFTSSASMDGGRIECQHLTQGSADISNLTIATSSPTSTGTLQDPVFGTTTDLHDITFVQAGAGHAIELDTATSYSFNNINFSGYGANTTDSAALDVTASTGTVIINVVGGTSPTYKTAGATVSIVVNPVTTQITVKDIDDATTISGARVLVQVADNTNFPYLAAVSGTSSSTTATITHTAHGLATSDNVIIRGAVEDPYNGAYSITVTDSNTYTYTMSETTTSPATGTLTSTLALINGTTDTDGIISDQRTMALNQPISGWVRMASASPYYKQQPISDTVDNTTGKSITAQLIKDE